MPQSDYVRLKDKKVHKLIKLEATRRDMDMGRLVTLAVEALTGDLAAVAALGPTRAEKVRLILETGDQETVDHLLGTIDFLFQTLPHVASGGTPDR
jgi:hypothetical protein